MVTVRYHTQEAQYDAAGMTVADLVREMRQGLGEIEAIPADKQLTVFVNGQEAEQNYRFTGTETVEVKAKAGVLA